MIELPSMRTIRDLIIFAVVFLYSSPFVIAFSHHQLCYYRKTYVRTLLHFEAARRQSDFFLRARRTNKECFVFLLVVRLNNIKTNWSFVGLMIEFCCFFSNIDKNNAREKEEGGGKKSFFANASSKRRCLWQKYLHFAVNDRRKRKKRNKVEYTAARNICFFSFFPFSTPIRRSIFNTRKRKNNGWLHQLDVVACSGWSCCKRVSIKRSGSLMRIDNQQGVEVISR